MRTQAPQWLLSSQLPPLHIRLHRVVVGFILPAAPTLVLVLGVGGFLPALPLLLEFMASEGLAA